MQSEWDGDHVILLSADALRADHLSCYGYHRKTSPTLDELADECILFKNAYSASSHTREAIPSLLTGKFPDIAVSSDYRRDEETIASLLSETDFATGGFHSNPYVSRAYGFDQGFDEFDDDLHFGQHKLVALAQRVLDKIRNRHYARAEEINKRSLSWIDSLEEGRSFFVWNHYMDTHGPYEPPREFLEMYSDDSLSGRDAQGLYRRAIKDPESITDSERELMVDCYDAEIRYNDEQIGAYLDSLHERNLLDTSLLIITADHGDAFGEHDYFGHPRYLHKEVTHVPMLIRPPGGVEKKRSVFTPVSTIDVVATILEAVGLNHEAPGESLLEPLDQDRTVFSQARGEGGDAHIRRYVARTRENVCFCERDREADAFEFGECSDQTLRTTLESHVNSREQVDTSGTISEDDVDDEINRRLEALGYKE